MISSADGSIPAAIMSLTVWPAACGESNAASSVCTTSGLLTMRSVTLVATPSVPSEPTNTPVRSYPGASSVAEPSCTSSPLGKTTSSPSVCVTVNPYFRQCAPPEFSATLPPIVHTDCDDGLGASSVAEPSCTSSPLGSTTSSPSVCVTVNPYFRQCAPPEFSATLPPIVHTDCDDGSGA